MSARVQKLIIMAAGVSSRMRNSEPPSGLSEQLIEQANTRHKSMLSIAQGGVPFMQLILKNAAEAGIIEVAFVVSPVENSVSEYYKDLSGTTQVYGLTLYFVLQHIPAGRIKPAGTADAVVQVLDALPEWENKTVLVCNGDNLYSAHAFDLMCQNADTNGLISYSPEGLGFDQEKLTKMGIVVSESNTLQQIVEKPSMEELLRLQSTYNIGISMSIFRFVMPIAASYIRSVQFDAVHNEKFITNAVADLLANGIKIEVVEVSEPLPDLTTKSDVLEVQKLLLQAEYHI